ncbi:MAG TPA: hypothetical protein VFV66_09250 [Nonomuraea sp.]|nr:hypothetical protein [Nonomuraea sp.]
MTVLPAAQEPPASHPAGTLTVPAPRAPLTRPEPPHAPATGRPRTPRAGGWPEAARA